MSIDLLARWSLTLAGQSLIHGTALALLTWLLCATLFRRARPAFHAALWTVALVKFLIPPVLPGEMALSSWLAQAGRAWTVQQTSTPEVLAGTWVSARDDDATSERSQNTAGPTLPAALLAGYFLGLAWIASRAGLRAVRLRRELRLAPPLEGPVADEARNLAERLGIGRRIAFRIGTPGQTPYVTGLWAPKVVLPPSAIGMADSPRRALILHELAHVRRGDLWVRWLENAARVLFFFWPPVWWACRRLERDSEMACDQWALEISRVPPDVYARSLLEIVKSIAASPLQRRQLAFAGKPAHLEERFKMILERKKSSPGLSWMMLPPLALWTAFAVAGGQASTPQSEKAGKEKAQTIVVHSGDEETLPAAVLEKFPEADLNGDGTLTVRELKRHLGAGAKEEGVHRFLIRKRADGASAEADSGDAMEIMLERFPEADSNGDGRLDPEEMRAHLKEHEGRHHIFTSAGPGHPGHAAVFVSGEGPMEEQGFDVVAGSRAELLQSHPEADADGDGELSRRELQDWGRAKAAELGRFSVRLGSPREEGAKVEVYVWNGQGADFNWTSIEGESSHEGSNDSRDVVVKLRKKIGEEDGGDELVKTIVVEIRDDLGEAEKLAQGEVLTEGRSDRLLAKHPDADLDGDGKLSREEAAALAARLSKEKNAKPRD